MVARDDERALDLDGAWPFFAARAARFDFFILSLFEQPRLRALHSSQAKGLWEDGSVEVRQVPSAHCSQGGSCMHIDQYEPWRLKASDLPIYASTGTGGSPGSERTDPCTSCSGNRPLP